MLSVLYNLFITPIETVVALIFSIMNRVFFDHPGVSILFVSIVVNLLVLPLYKRADAIQDEERARQKSMERWTTHIRKTFKGDERFMMQNAYYKEMGYKPIYALKGSLSILLQIPFFIAAYHFLSTLELLNGAGFLMISDLGSPDGLIKIAGLSINLLPILMTAINMISGVIYTKGFPLKDKLQLYITALVFLVLLYQSPSGLVLYWTFNNLFSLGKNIFFKYVKHKSLVTAALSMFVGAGLFVSLFIMGRLDATRKLVLFGGIMVISFIPMLILLIKKITGKRNAAAAESEQTAHAENEAVGKNTKERSNFGKTMFFLGCAFLTIFLGAYIPSGIIVSAPVDFCAGGKGPYGLIVNTVSSYAGLFIVWFGIFYLIANGKVRKLFAYFTGIASVVSVLDYYFFYGKFGTMTNTLVFHAAPTFTGRSKVINLIVLIFAVAAVALLFKFIPKIVNYAYLVLSIAALAFVIINVTKTEGALREEKYYEVARDAEYSPIIKLDKDGENVVFIMLDRSISEYFPYMMNEKKELAEAFEDFVYYPNTISFGPYTNLGTPALFGGYEYTPEEINKRSDELLKDKQNEALKVMPVLFADNGFNVTVCDPPYADYCEVPNLSIYDGYDGICAYNTEGVYSAEFDNLSDKSFQERNFVFYSLFRAFPVALQSYVYDNGKYLGTASWDGVNQQFVDSYSVLDGLPELTLVSDNGSKNFFMIDNTATHEPCLLRSPEYEISYSPDTVPYPAERADSYVLDGERLLFTDTNKASHYHVNMASFLKLAEWFDYLKAEGIYDNTRIIIAADHGSNVGQIESRILSNGIDVEFFNPMMLVKDFGTIEDRDTSHFSKITGTEIFYSDEFMTNADVPALAVEGVIANPVNPFTGKKISSDEKTAHAQKITTSCNWEIDDTAYTFDTSDGEWYEVKDNIFEADNWVKFSDN